VDNLVARGELKQWDELKEQREPKH
jgi:hypothetical protein